MNYFETGGLRVCSIASGSSGNCYLVRTDNTALLVDAGISGKRILEGLVSVGTDPQFVSALLLTHEHEDHVKSVRVLSKKIDGLKVFSSMGTWKAICDKLEKVEHYDTFAGETIKLGDISVTSFALSHDAAEPIGYSFESGGRRMTILTDSGCIGEDAHQLLSDSQLMVLESNHDVGALHFCRYPYSLKRRILSDQGHLSNEAAGKEICRILRESEGEEIPTVLLAHLSHETNFPELAFTTVQNILAEEGYYIDRHVRVAVLLRDQISQVFLV